MILINILAFMADPVNIGKDVVDSIETEVKSSTTMLPSLSFDEIIKKLIS